MNDARPLPSAIPDELTVIASVFSRSGLETALSTGLLPDDLYDRINQVVFSELVRRYPKGEPLDMALVIRDLECDKRLTQEQVAEFVSRETCSCVNANIPHYCKPIKDAAARRRKIEEAYKQIEVAYNPDTSVEIAETPAWIIPDLSPRRFFETEPMEFEFILPGFLPKGIVGFLYGAGGAYKSLAALWMILQRAIFKIDNSQKWLDRVPLSGAGRSIFFSAEDTELDLHHRVRNIVSRIHETRPDVPLETFWQAIGENALILSREQWKQDGELFLVDDKGNPTLKTRPVIQLIKDFGADLAVLETYSRIANVDEIDNRTAARVVGVLEEIRDQTGATILCIAHSSKMSRAAKTDQNDQNALRGAGALLDNARWGLSFRSITRGDNDRDRIEINHAKGFRSKRVEPFTIEVEYPGFKVVEVEKPKGKSVVELESLTALVETRQQWSFSELRTMVMEKTGKATRTAERRIEDLLNLGKIIKNPEGIYEVNL